MLQIYNKTPFTASFGLFPDKDGVDTVVAVIKATFDLLKSEDRVCVSNNQLPLIQADEYWGDPGNSSIKYAAEIAPPKPATDIVMNGHTYSPKDKPVKKQVVALKVGKYEKKVIVYGDRVWERKIDGYFMTAPAPFTKMPLVYERAFGGKDFDKSDQIVCEQRNPVGSGFKHKKGKNDLNGSKLPNIENPDKLIKNRQDLPKPEGFGYIAPDWESRKQFIGTYDEHWRKNKAPFLPEDFNTAFFNCAHPDLITDSYLQGDEEIFIKNAGMYRTKEFRLPKMQFQVTFQIDGKQIKQHPEMDTLLIEPDNERFSMIWRTALQCDKRTLKIQSIKIHNIESNIELKG